MSDAHVTQKSGTWGHEESHQMCTVPSTRGWPPQSLEIMLWESNSFRQKHQIILKYYYLKLIMIKIIIIPNLYLPIFLRLMCPITSNGMLFSSFCDSIKSPF